MDGFLFLLMNKTHRERLRKMFLFLGTNPSVWGAPKRFPFSLFWFLVCYIMSRDHVFAGSAPDRLQEWRGRGQEGYSRAGRSKARERHCWNAFENIGDLRAPLNISGCGSFSIPPREGAGTRGGKLSDSTHRRWFYHSAEQPQCPRGLRYTFATYLLILCNEQKEKWNLLRVGKGVFSFHFN